jgi:hypothetical protein
MPVRCTPLRYMSIRYMPVRCTPVRCTSMCHGNQIPSLSHIRFRAILKPSAFHIGREVALDALSCTYTLESLR